MTGIVRDVEQNYRFYSELLGLPLCKHTVNLNDKFTRHLFYRGELGTVLTFFPYPAEDDGRVGKPQISTAALTIPPESVGFWQDRFVSTGLEVDGPFERFDETVLQFRDPDGTHLELVTGESPFESVTDGPVPARHAIRSIQGVTLLSADIYVTASVLETLGFSLVDQEGDRIRYRAKGDRATVVDLLEGDFEYGREGAGSIHHVAVRIPDTEQLYAWHKLFRRREYDVSRVKDRHFFHSLYVREPGGILFELATEQPGLAVKSGSETSSTSLYLPPWLEVDRELIESQLPPFAIQSP